MSNSFISKICLQEGSNWKGKGEFISIGASLPFIFFQILTASK